MPGIDENQAAPTAADAPAKTGPAPGKIRVEEMTLDRFNEDQRSALQQANMDRTIKGLPSYEVADFVRVYPDKFKNVDHDLDDAERIERNKAKPEVSAAQRVDQRQPG